MPDSIYVTTELINQVDHSHFIELELNYQRVKMLIKSPSKGRFYLEPEMEEHNLWFADFMKYDGQIDTAYYDIIYHNGKGF